MSITLRSRLGKLGAVTAVLTAVSLGVVGCTTATQDDPPADAQAATQITTPRGVVDNAFQLGHGPVVVQVFTDASCPHCKNFDLAAYQDLQARVDSGEITLRLYPMNYVSAKHGDATAFSTRVMNLLAAVADGGQLDRVTAVYNGILEAQPDDETAPLPDNAKLLSIAAANGVHISEELRDAVESGRWDTWVQHVNDLAIGQPIGDSGVTLQYVPTVMVGDQQLEIREDGTDLQRLQEMIAAAR